MRVRGFNNVGKAAQTDPKLLRYASTIRKQKKRWELLAQKFDRFQTLRTRKTCNKVYKAPKRFLRKSGPLNSQDQKTEQE